MKIVTNQVKKISFVDVADLGTVDVFIEDYDNRSGQITIVYGNRGWSAKWFDDDYTSTVAYFCSLTHQELCEQFPGINTDCNTNPLTRLFTTVKVGLETIAAMESMSAPVIGAC